MERISKVNETLSTSLSNMEKSTKKQTGGVFRAIGKYLWGVLITVSILLLVTFILIDCFGFNALAPILYLSQGFFYLLDYKLIAYIIIGAILLIWLITLIAGAVKRKNVTKKEDCIAKIRQEAKSEVNRKFIDADDPEDENE